MKSSIGIISLIFFSLFLKETTTNFKNDDGFIIFNKIELNNISIKGNFLFDTGAQLTIIDSSLLKVINYKDIGYITSVDFLGNKKKVKKIHLSSVKIDDTYFYDIDAFVMNLSEYQCYNLKGIIGFNVIKKANWQIDLKNGEIKITDISQSIHHDKEINIPFKIKNNEISIDLKIDNKRYKTILDTGAKNEINLTLKDFEELRDKKQLKDSLYRVDLYSKTLNENVLSTKTVFLSKIKNLSIGNNIFEKKVTFFGVRTLGVDFFENSDFLIFDFNHKKIFFTNSKKTSNEQIITKHGINFKKLDSGEIIVSYLRKKSTFDKLGVIIGDKVLSVNNIDCSGLNDCDCKYLLNKEIKKDSIKINFIAQGVLISSK